MRLDTARAVSDGEQAAENDDKHTSGSFEQDVESSDWDIS